jgi:LysM domain
MAHRPTFVLLLRGALLLALVGTAAVGLVSLCREPLRALAAALRDGGVPMLARLPFEELLTGGCALVMAVCALWLLAATGLAVVCQLAGAVTFGRRVPRCVDAFVERVCPALVRTLVVTALGAVVTTAISSPAPADTLGSGRPGHPESGAAALSGLALPDRVVGVAAGLGVSRAPATRTPHRVVVQAGDSLWSIAAELLPAGADDGRICADWHRLYRLNRNRIGADPDLILPGTVLEVPRSTAPRREDHS